MEFARWSHSVPEAYLRGWSDDGVHVLARRLLVPVESYPDWQRARIRSLAVYEHLYTTAYNGVASDELERWFNEAFESPAAEAIAKVRSNARLNTSDYHRLIYYLASLDVRTPVSYIEHQRLWEREMPQLMDDVMQGAKHQLERAATEGIPLPRPTDPEDNPIPLTVTIDRDAPDGPRIKAQVVLGRELWIHSIRRILRGIVSVLKNHQWHIVRPHHGYAWPTSDHPVLRLNFNSVDEYDFGGGWGNKGSEILLPLSPEHLLYTQVGHRHSGQFRFSESQTRLVLRFLAERAHRWIITHPDSPRPPNDRHRRVDKEAFHEEERAWIEWHDSQSRAVKKEDAA